MSLSPSTKTHPLKDADKLAEIVMSIIALAKAIIVEEECAHIRISRELVCFSNKFS